MNYTIPVRALCEFAARRGDLDLRFTPVPTAQQGMEGHAIVRARRKDNYEKEVSLSETIALGDSGHALIVRGRADGYDPQLRQLEEIKTYRGALEAMPDNHRALHWAQARVYGHLLCRQRGLDRLRVALVYYHIDERTETMFTEEHSAATLCAAFTRLCEQFSDWAISETRHRDSRNHVLSALDFPYPALRDGQRKLAETVYKATLQGRCLLAQAPTGIGKTLGTLFPMLKAAPRSELDKIYFLTAKTSGRRMALDSLTQLLADRPPSVLRVLELGAREKVCEHPDKACHGASCPLARGFYDKLPGARRQAVDHGWLAHAALRDIALAHEICPYWLGHELTQWADVIVGDYNYYFDTTAMLRGLASSRQWRIGLLVDEAHNLLERARDMYSAALSTQTLHAAQRTAPAGVKQSLASLLRACGNALRDQEQDYQAYPEIPAKLHGALLKTSAVLADHVNQQPPQDNDASMLQLHFDLLHFLALADSFDTHSVFDVTMSQRSQKAPSPAARSVDTVMTVRNVVPAPFLQPSLALSHCAALFSATLAPWDFYRDTLGLPQDTAWIDVETPFKSSQLEVKIARGISTRYRDREHSVESIVRLMRDQYDSQPGNYLSYFSSFSYLDQVATHFITCFPDIPVWTQSRGMHEADRNRFLQRFTPSGRGIGFAVLGGAFAEGIDLPGERLIGAFISTLGLPQFNDINEQIKLRMTQAFGAQRGYEYAYLYPGLQKVVQAAGRVIRGDSDRGVVHLIDDRYAQARIRALLPRWWLL